jgi:hypothetical protein
MFIYIWVPGDVQVSHEFSGIFLNFILGSCSSRLNSGQIVNKLLFNIFVHHLAIFFQNVVEMGSKYFWRFYGNFWWEETMRE